MEKPSFVFNGGMKLPIGYRFRPTDEELVIHYLRRKAFGVSLPASVIPELDVFQADPWSLPGDLKEKRYFFRRRRGNENGKIYNNAPGTGYWKFISKDKRIVASSSNQVVGVRRKLVLCQTKQSNKTRTQWIMHEYSLVGFASIPSATHQMCEVKLGDWVVYCVFQRKRKVKKHGVISDKLPSNIKVDHENVADPPEPCSPCSSGVTEVSSNELEQEETSSFNSFSF